MQNHGYLKVHLARAELLSRMRWDAREKEHNYGRTTSRAAVHSASDTVVAAIHHVGYVAMYHIDR